MINNDAVFEICKELCMLSQYSTACIDQSNLHECGELASLCAELKAVSKQAENLMQSGKVRVDESLKCEMPSQHTGTDDITSIAVASKAVKKDIARHGWIVEILKDLSRYAKSNDLSELSIELIRLHSQAKAHLNGGLSSIGGVTIIGDQTNVISFGAPSRGRWT